MINGEVRTKESVNKRIANTSECSGKEKKMNIFLVKRMKRNIMFVLKYIFTVRIKSGVREIYISIQVLLLSDGQP